MNIEFLKRRIEDAREQVQLTAKRLAETPTDFWLNAALENQLQVLRDTEIELKIACSDNAGES